MEKRQRNSCSKTKLILSMTIGDWTHFSPSARIRVSAGRRARMSTVHPGKSPARRNMSTLRYRPKHSPCWTRSNNPPPFQRPVISGQDFDYHSCPDVLEARCIDQNRSIFTVRTFGQKVVDRFQADWSIFKRLDLQN